MSSSKPKTAYRATQAIAKSLGLPGNLKHSVLETLINARQNGNESIVSEILRQTKEERDKRKKEKAEIRQTNYNLRMDTHHRSNCTDIIVPPPTPVKRPLGRPRKNRIPDPQPEQFHPHQRITQADEEALLQSRNVTEFVKLFDSTYKANKYNVANNNNNNNDKTECQQRSCLKQMGTRNPNTLFVQQNYRAAPRTNSCYSASVNPPHSVYNNFSFNNIYAPAQEVAKPAPGYAFKKKIYKQMIQEDQCGISLLPNAKYGSRYPTTTAHHYPQPNLYKQNRQNVSVQRSIGTPYPSIQQTPIEYSYVPGGGYFHPQRNANYFPTTPGPSSIQEPPPPYRTRPSSVQNYMDPYLRPHNNDSFNLRYGINNQAQMVVSTTPLSDSTISANEVDDNNVHYDNSTTPTLFNRTDLDTLIAAANTSQADNSNINYLTSCSTAGTLAAPSCSARTITNNGGGLLSSSSSLANTSNQTVYYPSFSFEAMQNVQNSSKQDMFSGNDISYVYNDENNQNYKREIFDESGPSATIEQISDQLAAVENCNDLMSASVSSSILATTTNTGVLSNTSTNDTSQDLQQVINFEDCVETRVAKLENLSTSPVKEEAGNNTYYVQTDNANEIYIYESVLVPQGLEEGNTITDEISDLTLAGIGISETEQVITTSMLESVFGDSSFSNGQQICGNDPLADSPCSSSSSSSIINLCTSTHNASTSTQNPSTPKQQHNLSGTSIESSSKRRTTHRAKKPANEVFPILVYDCDSDGSLTIKELGANRDSSDCDINETTDEDFVSVDHVQEYNTLGVDVVLCDDNAVGEYTTSSSQKGRYILQGPFI